MGLAFILIGVFVVFSQEKTEVKKIPLPVLDKTIKDGLLDYLKKNFKNPEEYVLSKFKDHDIIFIGEYHRIKHDVDLISRLIPLLYKVGVYNLGIEFGAYHDQDRVDKLIQAETYDADAAREIMFHFSSFWGYQEYMDIYRAAWDVNHGLPQGTPRFRVVNLNARADWSYIKTPEDRNNPEIMKKVFFEGESDEFMAKTIIKEFIEKDQKALVYSGIHHAFTRYKQPIVDKGKFVRYTEKRTGNLIYNRLGERVFTIFLHAPWSDKNYQNEIYPVDGVIDALLFDSPLRPVGFDLAGTPFGELGAKDSYYAQGYEPFALKMYCDGYIYTKAISQYQGVTTDENFITEKNFKQAIEQIPNPLFKTRVTGVAILIEAMKSDANMPRRFRQFF